MDSDFVGSKVAYTLFGAMMHSTLQKFIANFILCQKKHNFSCTQVTLVFLWEKIWKFQQPHEVRSLILTTILTPMGCFTLYWSAFILVGNCISINLQSKFIKLSPYSTIPYIGVRFITISRIVQHEIVCHLNVMRWKDSMKVSHKGRNWDLKYQEKVNIHFKYF